MQDDSTKLIEIFKELQRLQTYHRQIKQVKRRLQKIMEKEAVKLTGSEFEAKLASHIHPFMYSYPAPLGDRYRDVQCLLNELADKQGLKHQQYLETILPLKENGYRYAVCNSGTFSPTNSGLNIDPQTFSFRASASDDCLYFSLSKSSHSSLVKDTSEFVSTQEGVETGATSAPITVAESMVCHPPSEYRAGTSLVSLDYVTSPESPESPPPAPTFTEKSETADVPRPDSLTCNKPESTYQSLVRSSTSLSSSSRSTSSQDPPHSPDSGTTKNTTKEYDSTVSYSQDPVHSPDSGTTKEYDSMVSSYDELSRYKEFYTVPVSGLDSVTYSKYRTVKRMVVSQTWLTGWIKDLYQIESEIVKSTGSKPLK